MTTLNLIVLGTAQDRLRMVGGLQSLVKTLRDIANSSQQECDGNVAQVFELALHIVKTLSAAAFGHCKMRMYFTCGISLLIENFSISFRG